jgi:hypothetical protein
MPHKNRSDDTTTDNIKTDKEIVIFAISKESQCAECGVELRQGDFLRKEQDRVLCLECADLDHLIFLSRGDATLTRRANKYSSLKAVVVKFSKSRQRYERQGILVEANALQQAEVDCLSDAQLRQRRREQNATKRDQLDHAYVASFAAHIVQQYPGCPVTEATLIAEHTCRKHSGRVGRSAAAKEFKPEAIDFAVIAHIRHRYTNYDELLMKGWERPAARSQIAAQLQAVVEQWRQASHTL